MSVIAKGARLRARLSLVGCFDNDHAITRSTGSVDYITALLQGYEEQSAGGRDASRPVPPTTKYFPGQLPIADAAAPLSDKRVDLYRRLAR